MHALRVLEFDQVRGRLAECCETSVAASVALDLEPSFDEDAIWARLELTGEADDLLNRHGAPPLGAVRDLADAVGRSAKGGSLDGATLHQIGEALGAMRAFRFAVAPKRESYPRLGNLSDRLADQGELERRLLDSLDGSGDVRDEASPELARLRRHRAATAQRLLERVQSYTSGPRRDLLSDPIVTQRDGRYVVPLKAEHRSRIKGVVHDTSATGQTLFIEPDDVLQIGNALREAEAQERAEVARVLAMLSKRVGDRAPQIVEGLQAAYEIDLALAMARHGHREGGALPERVPGPRIAIESGRHPLIDRGQAVPLTIDLGRDQDGILITGPNTGGKTVAIKTVGLFVLMAQSGLMPPARMVRLGAFSQVWADIGDEQSLQQSLSTFSGHIKNIAEALKGLQPGALVLFDEIGAGTDPAEGAALAKVILLEIQSRGAKVLASTHYGELKVFAYNAEGFQNAAMEFDIKSLRPTYRLIMGAPGASHAMRIAERYGIPADVVERARADPGVERQDVAKMLERLEQAQKQAQRAQSEADRLTSRLRQVEGETERKLADAEEARRTARAKAAETLEAALREIRLEAQSIFEEVKADPSAKGLERARSRLKDLQAVGQDCAKEMKPMPKPVAARKIAKGDSVRVSGTTQTGTVLDAPRGGNVQVQVGPIKMTVPIANLELAPVEPPPRPKVSPRQNLGLKKAQVAGTEIHLRHHRAEEAGHILDRFLDDSVLAGVPFVRIVHGKGEGVLRKLVHEVLRKHKEVSSFRLGEAGEGGDGVTIAFF